VVAENIFFFNIAATFAKMYQWTFLYFYFASNS
jgi:hypothetical protein